MVQAGSTRRGAPLAPAAQNRTRWHCERKPGTLFLTSGLSVSSLGENKRIVSCQISCKSSREKSIGLKENTTIRMLSVLSCFKTVLIYNFRIISFSVRHAFQRVFPENVSDCHLPQSDSRLHRMSRVFPQ